MSLKLLTKVAGAMAAACLVVPGAASATTLNVSVAAAGSGGAYYVDTGIPLAAGQSVTITASGTWLVCPPDRSECATGPDGTSAFGIDSFTDPFAYAGTLIASTDGGATWSAVGSGPTVVAGPGELLLATNDYSWGYFDNTGSVAAVVTFNYVVPTSIDNCQKGGWQTLTDSTGRHFKNQGDCVSYVATRARNTAAGV